MAELTTMYPAQANSPSTMTTGALTSVATEIVVADGTVLPAAPNLLVLGVDSTAETVLMTAKSGNTLTVQRAVQGSAKAWPAATTVARRWTAKDHTDLVENVKAVNTDLNTHKGSTSNPHSVTKAQVGLGNVDNTADANKPVSTAQQTAINTAKAAAISTASSDATTKANAAETNAKDASDPTGTAVSKVSTHNTAADAHSTKFAAKLDKAGGTMTGALILAADPTADNGAATKKYVDDHSGGFSPQIEVSVDTGAAVTCTDGTTTLSGTSAAGKCTFDIPNYGTWTVQATLGGSTSTSMAIVVDSVKKYTAALVFASATFGSNSWATIRAVSASGIASTLWSRGDKKSITLSTGQTVNVVIADFGHDVDADGNPIGLTLVLEDCLNTKYQMNSSNTNAGGWASCALRTTLNSTILGYLPSDLQAVIAAAHKKSSAGSQSSTITTTDDKLWLLSEIELFGSTTYSFAGEGTQYPIFSSNTARVKKVNGSASYWWERSPYSSSSTLFCLVNSDGTATNAGASVSFGVAFGFCV